MKLLLDALPTNRYEDVDDADGNKTRLLVLGSESRGCKYCGSVSLKYSGNGKVKLYHPSAECCGRAINDQMDFRRAEIDQWKKRMAEDNEAVNRLEEEAESYGDSKMGTAEQARHKAQKARAGYTKKSSEVYQANIRELAAEITRLKAIRIKEN